MGDRREEGDREVIEGLGRKGKSGSRSSESHLIRYVLKQYNLYHLHIVWNAALPDTAAVVIHVPLGPASIIYQRATEGVSDSTHRHLNTCCINLEVAVAVHMIMQNKRELQCHNWLHLYMTL